MTEYKVCVSKCMRLVEVEGSPFSSRTLAEHAMRREIFNRFGRISITPLSDGELYLNSRTSLPVGSIVEVKTGETDESVSKKLRNWIIQQEMNGG